MELSIDTSTDVASIALSQQGEVRGELTWFSGQNHTAELLPAIEHLLRLAKVKINDLKGVIVSKGPGSFNGLRVGMSAAKGFVLALGIPVVGIGTLEVIAYPHILTSLPIQPILNAGRGELATARFRAIRGQWQRLEEEHLTTLQMLCAQTAEKTIFCGQVFPDQALEIRGRLGEKAVIPSSAANLRRAGFLAELGWRRLATGNHDDPITLQPLYLRPPAITLKRKGVNSVTNRESNDGS